MTCESESPEADSPGSIAQGRVESHLVQEQAETGEHEAAIRGGTVVYRARRGARHRIIIMGQTEVDRRVEE